MTAEKIKEVTEFFAKKLKGFMEINFRLLCSTALVPEGIMKKTAI